MLSRLKRHEKSHESRKCEFCDSSFDKWSLFLAHKHKEHLNSEHKCSVCDQEFHSKRDVKNHQKNHHNLGNQTIYQCTFENCPKIFLQRNNMLAHYRSKHENRKFLCTFEGCTSKLSTKQKLNQHIKSIHLGGKKSKTQSKHPKAERKDKGVQKTSTASKMFNIILPAEFEQAIIAGQGKTIHIEYDRIDENNVNDEDNGNCPIENSGLNNPQLNGTCGTLVQC